MPGQAERKRWWRNTREAQPVDVWLAGTHLDGVALVTCDGTDGDELTEGLAACRVLFSRVPNATVMVRVNLTPTTSADGP